MRTGRFHIAGQRRSSPPSARLCARSLNDGASLLWILLPRGSKPGRMGGVAFGVSACLGCGQSTDSKAPILNQISKLGSVLAADKKTAAPRLRKALASVRQRMTWPIPMAMDESTWKTMFVPVALTKLKIESQDLRHYPLSLKLPLGSSRLPGFNQMDHFQHKISIDTNIPVNDSLDEVK
jgi:hypothetical protein